MFDLEFYALFLKKLVLITKSLDLIIDPLEFEHKKLIVFFAKKLINCLVLSHMESCYQFKLILSLRKGINAHNIKKIQSLRPDLIIKVAFPLN